MHLPPLLLLLLASLALTHASAHQAPYHVPRALHARAPSAHHSPHHHGHHPRSARPVKALHKRLWYSPTRDVPESEPESPESSLYEEEQAAPFPGGTSPTPGGIPIPRGSPLAIYPGTPSTPRVGSTGSLPKVGSLGRIGSTGSFPRPISRVGSSGIFLQGEQLKNHCVDHCTCKKVGQMPAELKNHGMKHCGSRCQGVCHCGENR